MTILPIQKNLTHGYSKRLSIIQRVLTPYRARFFEKLAMVPGYTISVFAGQPMIGEGIKTTDISENFQHYSTKNRYWLRDDKTIIMQANLQEWLNDFDPDVLVMEANPRIISHWQAMRWMHNRGRPVLGWGLGELERTGSAWSLIVRRLVAQKLVRTLDGIIAYSTKAKADYISAGIAADSVFVAHNSIDNEDSERYLAELSDSEWSGPWRANYGLDPYLPIVLFVGRLITSKQIDLLIQACIPLLERCQLLIVGDGSARKDLELVAAPYIKHICFVGHQTGEDLAKSFIGSDIFVLPAAGGLALHQAMSYGKPVIASFGDGTEADLIRDGYNGFSFRLGDVAQLTTKIELLLNEPERIREMGKASLGIVRNEINLQKMVSSYITAVETIKVRGL